MRTSLSHPLQIAEIRPAESYGLLGITFCPGKVQSFGLTGSWHRDLGLDLDVIEDWNAAVVVTLVEERELALLEVPNLGTAVRNRHIDWVHLPIRDRDVPDAAFEAHWAVIGAGLLDRLRAGFNVVVHCMGGLGRAGTIASRLLIELGWEITDAVSEVRRVRPGAIETDQQMDYVYAQSEAPRENPAGDPKAIRDRGIGALVGLAVGDAVGTTLEFRARDGYPRLTDMVGGGPFDLEAGQWTDDTAMALALADSLLAHQPFDASDCAQRFVSWMDEGAYSSTGACFDIGITTRQALQRFKQTSDAYAGSSDPMSAGNGSLMRLTPVALRYWNEPDILKAVAAEQSRITHGADEAVDACVTYAELLAAAIGGTDRASLFAPRAFDGSASIAAIMAGSWRGKARCDILSSGYVVHSLEAALWCVARTASYRDAVLLAANLGDDADTTAAIAGQLAGALYGLRAIPRDWLGRLAMQGRIVGMGQALMDGAGLPRSLADEA